MQSISIFVSVFTLTLALAYPTRADYLPGRSRDSAEGKMRISEASGEFARSSQATVTQIYTDGAGVTAFRVTVDERSHHFVVKSLQRSDCGDAYLAEEVNLPEGQESKLMLQDYGTAACERDSKEDWIVSLQLRRGDQLSTLRALGQPEYFPLTQGGR